MSKSKMSQVQLPKVDDRSVKPKQQPITSSKFGRNDPCPCGSGKKYKYCCIKN